MKVKTRNKSLAGIQGQGIEVAEVAATMHEVVVDGDNDTVTCYTWHSGRSVKFFFKKDNPLHLLLTDGEKVQGWEFDFDSESKELDRELLLSVLRGAEEAVLDIGDSVAYAVEFLASNVPGTRDQYVENLESRIYGIESRSRVRELEQELEYVLGGGHKWLR